MGPGEIVANSLSEPVVLDWKQGILPRCRRCVVPLDIAAPPGESPRRFRASCPFCGRTLDVALRVRCEECARGKGFEPRHPRGRFCSGRCRVAAWQKRRVEEARSHAERVVRDLVAKVEEAVQEAREGLAGREGDR